MLNDAQGTEDDISDPSRGNPHPLVASYDFHGKIHSLYVTDEYEQNMFGTIIFIITIRGFVLFGTNSRGCRLRRAAGDGNPQLIKILRG